LPRGRQNDQPAPDLDRPDRYAASDQPPTSLWAALNARDEQPRSVAVPDGTAPVWLTVLVVAILAVSMFLAGFLVGGRMASGDVAAQPDVGRFSYEAGSGKLPSDEPAR